MTCQQCVYVRAVAATPDHPSSDANAQQKDRHGEPGQCIEVRARTGPMSRWQSYRDGDGDGDGNSSLNGRAHASAGGCSRSCKVPSRRWASWCKFCRHSTPCTRLWRMQPGRRPDPRGTGGGPVQHPPRKRRQQQRVGVESRPSVRTKRSGAAAEAGHLWWKLSLCIPSWRSDRRSDRRAAPERIRRMKQQEQKWERKEQE